MKDQTMTRLRSLILPLAATLALAACGDSKPETHAAPTPPAIETQIPVSDMGTSVDPLADIYGTSMTPVGPEAGSQADLVASAGDRVFFDTDRYDLTPESRAILEDQARWLQANPYVNAVVEGHADERGTREYNLALGERRAQAARSYLVALGVNPMRLTTISYGKERPAAAGSNPGAWALNRRAVSQVE